MLNQRTFSARRTRSLLLAGLLATACYTHTAVKPEALTALSDSFSTPVASSGGHLIAVRVARVERPDGTLVEVAGEFDVHLTLRNGRHLEIEHPVMALPDPTGTAIIIAGGNLAAQTIALEDMARVEVVQYDGTGTVLAASLIPTGAFLGGIAILLVLGI